MGNNHFLKTVNGKLISPSPVSVLASHLRLNFTFAKLSIILSKGPNTQLRCSGPKSQPVLRSLNRVEFKVPFFQEIALRALQEAR